MTDIRKNRRDVLRATFAGASLLGVLNVTPALAADWAKWLAAPELGSTDMGAPAKSSRDLRRPRARGSPCSFGLITKSGALSLGPVVP
jgi:hypothetical protein